MADVRPLYDKLGMIHPKLSRGLVRCKTCGREQSVRSASALQHGWPRCCGHTMTIDSPEDRKEPTHD